MEEKWDLENPSPGAEIQAFAQNRFEIFFSSLLQRVGNRRKDRRSHNKFYCETPLFASITTSQIKLTKA